ncbi:hypothetical protein EBR21_12355 [bacterium]|nr:hypothetical protein [bacterium]
MSPSVCHIFPESLLNDFHGKIFQAKSSYPRKAVKANCQLRVDSLRTRIMFLRRSGPESLGRENKEFFCGTRP